MELLSVIDELAVRAIGGGESVGHAYSVLQHLKPATSDGKELNEWLGRGLTLATLAGQRDEAARYAKTLSRRQCRHWLAETGCHRGAMTRWGEEHVVCLAFSGASAETTTAIVELGWVTAANQVTILAGLRHPSRLR